MEKELRAYAGMQIQQTVRTLELCNERTARFGLTLNGEEIAALAKGRTRALTDTGRVEFGEGILPQLILAFCDSPDLHPADYVQTLLTLQEVFYHLKNESRDRIPDDTLLKLMRRAFDGKARGAADLLAGMTPAELLAKEEPYDGETE